jgi:hypothetical protein
MSDEKPPDAPPAAEAPTAPDVMTVVEWLMNLGDGMPFEAVARLRDDVIAGREVLTDREKNILATAGAVLHNSASAHAFRMFQKAMGAAVMGAIRISGGGPPFGTDDDDDDEPEGGSKPS